MAIKWGLCSLFYGVIVEKTKTYGQGFVDKAHGKGVETAHFFFQPLLIKSSNLFQKHDRIFRKAAAMGIELYVSWQIRLRMLARDGRRNHSGAEFVANVILNDQNRAHPALLGANNRAQIGIKYITAFNSQCCSRSANFNLIRANGPTRVLLPDFGKNKHRRKINLSLHNIRIGADVTKKDS